MPALCFPPLCLQVVKSAKAARRSWQQQPPNVIVAHLGELGWAGLLAGLSGRQAGRCGASNTDREAWCTRHLPHNAPYATDRTAMYCASLHRTVLLRTAEEGIEAIHLFSGRTVCRLHLPSPGE